MATLTPEEQVNQLKALTTATKEAGDAQTGLDSVLTMVKSRFDDLAAAVKKAGGDLDNLDKLSNTNTDRLALLVSGVVKAREAFTGLGSVDFGNLNTFTSQMNNIKEALFSGGTAASEATKAVDKMITSLRLGHVAESAIAEAMKKGSAAVVDLYSNMMTGADNTLRFQRALFQLGAQTGQLNEIQEAAGKTMDGGAVKFGNLNAMTQVYTKSLLDTMDATGLSVTQVEKYFGSLATVPGAMTATVKGGVGMNENISMLTATIQYATGAGRRLEDVVDDMRVAFRDYNLTGEKALLFTARMGEIANKFHVELSDVQGSLRGTADAFKMFGDESEGAAHMMNEFLGPLTSGKFALSGHAAIEVVQGLTGGIKDMGIAQKAFLSAQTGGPGGLMGAFQIEKLLREGKIDEVFEKVRQQMTKQFGQIVTLDEASKSPQAAAALTKQMMILRQGPLGQFAKDDQSAIRLLEAFKAKAEGRPGALTTELSSRVVQDKMGEGNEIQKLSYTELTKINNKLEALRYFAGAGSLDLMQRTMTASAGHTARVGQETKTLRTQLEKNMEEADAGRDETKDLVKDLTTNLSTTNRFGANAVRGFVGIRHDLGAVAGSLRSAKVGDLVGIGERKENREARERAELSEQIEESRMGQFVGTVPGIAVPDLEEAATAGGVERAGARPAAAAPRAGAAVSAPGRLGEIVVHVEGLCIECGEKMRGTTQSYAVNTGQKARK